MTSLQQRLSCVERSSRKGRVPKNIALDGQAAPHEAARELPAENDTCLDTILRSPKYLNKPDLTGSSWREIMHWSDARLQDFKQATVTTAGIELLHRIHKGQFVLSRLRVQD